ncbi:hypothetical protein GKC56_05905 [Neisseriaceae bacterium PsAf]|nr:hypothetical protein [Neisseriaceae bacterium PsAf]
MKHKQKLPQLSSHIIHHDSHQNIISLKLSEKPKHITLWQAINKTDRDFRYSCDIRYTPSDIKVDFRQKNYLIPIRIPKKGWVSSFIEVTFNDELIMATEALILPHTYPSHQPQNRNNKLCNTFP